tara:strand:- start:606 stop:1325 length:720 start_codon:yes stop_codon:yes gene_type:complete
MAKFQHQGKEKKVYVEKMFNDISKRYDLFNTLSSLGIDRYWRGKLTSTFNLNKKNKLLDVATGTGDVVFSFYRKFKVSCVGVDIAYKMIKLANIKKDIKKISNNDIEFLTGDAEKLDFPDNLFDALTISFGFRNLGDYNKGLSEFCRVLKPGGQIAILEFSKSTSFWFRPIFNFYFNRIIPIIGSLLARKDAFLYLPESVDNFLSRKDVCSKMEKAGFVNITYKDYTFGIATIYTGIKS